MGWRIPFLISAVLLLVGYVIRIGVNESPEFAQVLERRERAEMPAKEVLRTAWRTVLLCMGVCTVAIGGIYFTNTFMLSYTTQTLGLNRALILDCLFVVAIIQFLVQPLAAWLADALGPARVLLTAAFCSVLAPYPMFMLVTQGTAYSIIAGIAIALVFMAAIYSAMAGYLSSAFAAPVRYSGISLSYQLCGALAGGMTPLVGTWLAFHYPGQWLPLAIFYSILSAISLLSIWALADTSAVLRARLPASRANGPRGRTPLIIPVIPILEGDDAAPSTPPAALDKALAAHPAGRGCAVRRAARIHPGSCAVSVAARAGAHGAGLSVRSDAPARFSMDRWKIDVKDIESHPGFGPVTVSYENAFNVVGAYRPGQQIGRSLILNGHRRGAHRAGRDLEPLALGTGHRGRMDAWPRRGYEGRAGGQSVRL